MVPHKDRDYLKRQLENLRESLRLIDERISEFVEPSQVPLQLIRDRKKQEDKIADIEAQLAALEKVPSPTDPQRATSRRVPTWLSLSVLSFLVVGVPLLLFFQRFQCFFIYRLLDDALIGWIVFLLGLVTAALSIREPKWKSSYRIVDIGMDLIPGIAIALVIGIVASKLIPPPAESECFPSTPTTEATVQPTNTPTLFLVSPDAPTATSSPTPFVFYYQVRVQVRGTGEYVQGAKVMIEVGQEVPPSDMTDAHGLAVIPINSAYENKLGKLIVEATGYTRYTEYVSLKKDALPKVVELVRLEPQP